MGEPRIAAEDAARRDAVLRCNAALLEERDPVRSRAGRARIIAETEGLPVATVLTILRRAEGRGTPVPEKAGMILTDGESVLRREQRAQAEAFAWAVDAGTGELVASPTGEVGLFLPPYADRLGLDVPGNLDYGRWSRLVSGVTMMTEAGPWWVGDLWVAGSEMFGEEAYQAVEERLVSKKTAQNYASVCRAFPRHRRRETVPSIGHYSLLVALPEGEQDRWLDWLEEPVKAGGTECRPRSDLLRALAGERARKEGARAGVLPRSAFEAVRGDAPDRHRDLERLEVPEARDGLDMPDDAPPLGEARRNRWIIGRLIGEAEGVDTEGLARIWLAAGLELHRRLTTAGEPVPGFAPAAAIDLLSEVAQLLDQARSGEREAAE